MLLKALLLFSSLLMVYIGTDDEAKGKTRWFSLIMAGLYFWAFLEVLQG